MFCLETWPEVPSDFHHPSSFRLMIIQYADKNFSDFLHSDNMQHGTQQTNIIQEFKHPTLIVTSKENGCLVNVVNWFGS